MTLYGKDVSIDDIVSNAKRYPMMSERQVVIVKEAQHLSRTIEQLATYAEHPQPSTVLVICYKYKKLDKRKKLHKVLKAPNGVVFESKKLYENQVSDWIRKMLKNKGFSISHKASILLVEFLGTDLSRIHNELEKLEIVLPTNTEITPEIIEKHIGISKDYNNFELKKAIGEKDVMKAATDHQLLFTKPQGESVCGHCFSLAYLLLSTSSISRVARPLCQKCGKRLKDQSLFRRRIPNCCQELFHEKVE